MPLYTTDALVLRTYKLGEADRIVVFLTADRGKKRGVARSARRPRSRFVGALLFNLEPRDPRTLLTSATVLIAVGALAAWLPARRAAHTDPMRVLRNG